MLLESAERTPRLPGRLARLAKVAARPIRDRLERSRSPALPAPRLSRSLVLTGSSDRPRPLVLTGPGGLPGVREFHRPLGLHCPLELGRPLVLAVLAIARELLLRSLVLPGFLGLARPLRLRCSPGLR